MSDDITKSLIFSLGKTKRDFLNKLEKWNKLAPHIQRDLEYQEWMENAVELEPEILSLHIDENLKSTLTSGYETLPGLLNIPEPPDDIQTHILASGTAAPIQYTRYMIHLERNQSDNAHVINWAKEHIANYNKLRNTHNTSAEVSRRVLKLNPMLGDLHNSSINAILQCSANQIEPPLAAVVSRRLLEQFKGHLIAHCRTGKKTSYKRISDNLAADSVLTKSAIETEQETYDRLWTELTHIVKRIKNVGPDYLKELFRELEDHIMVVTSAIDPNKIGFDFID